jgi:hypothetical protein
MLVHSSPGQCPLPWLLLRNQQFCPLLLLHHHQMSTQRKKDK